MSNKMSAPEESNYSKLELEAIKRRERLKALKRKAENKSDESKSTDDTKTQFRSYKSTEENETEAETPAEPILGDIESEVKNQLELMKTPIIIDEIDIANLAPRKPDWDLKRDVSKKLEKLERRTQKAIAELIRDRLKNDQDNILQAVNVGSAIVSTSQD